MSGTFATPATPADNLEEHAVNDHVMVRQGTTEGVRGFKSNTCPGKILEVIRNKQREITHYVVKKFTERSSGEMVERPFVFKDTDFSMQPTNHKWSPREKARPGAGNPGEDQGRNWKIGTPPPFPPPLSYFFMTPPPPVSCHNPLTPLFHSFHQVVEEHTAAPKKLKAELQQLKVSSSKSIAKLKKKGKVELQAAELRHSRALKKEKEAHAKEKKGLVDFKKGLERNAAWLQR
jgi:hypothetical protein